MILSKPQTIILPTQGNCNTYVTPLCDKRDESAKVPLAYALAKGALSEIRGPPAIHHVRVFSSMLYDKGAYSGFCLRVCVCRGERLPLIGILCTVFQAEGVKELYGRSIFLHEKRNRTR